MNDLFLVFLFVFFFLESIFSSPTCDHTDCNAGYFWDEGSNNCNDCSNCPVGYYCPNDGNKIPCPVGTARNSIRGTSIAACSACGSGTYAATEVCPAGYRCPTTTDFPTPCPLGQYSAAGETSCTVCPAGRHCPHPSVNALLAEFKCGEGYYSQEGATECTLCPSGTYSAEESSSCTVCEAGNSCVNGKKTPCPAGSIATGGASTCELCPFGTHTNGAGTASVCLDCGVDEDCSDPSSSPTSCADASYSEVGSSTCTKCLPGSYGDGTTDCTECTEGYSCKDPTVNRVLCTLGTYSVAGSSVCQMCPPGHYCPSRTGLPIQCNPGTYSEGGIVSVCSNCVGGAGGYQDEYGAIKCKYCGIGNVCTATTITPCAAGTYSGTPAAGCVPCGNGEYSMAGARFCETCPGGHQCLSKSELPEKCVGEREYNPEDSTVACQTCGAGYVVTKDHTRCIKCRPGYYCPDAVEPETRCAIGTYSGEGATSCTTCEKGYKCPTPELSPIYCFTGYSPAGSTDCLLCPEGFECPNPTSNPVPCADGKSSALGEDHCYDCEEDNFCTGATENRTLRCPPGYFRKAVNAECTICPAGQWCVNGLAAMNCPNAANEAYYSLDGETSCTPCPAGYKCPNNDEEPVLCEEGEYSTGLQIACNVCPEGFRCPRKDEYLLVLCEPGTYSGTSQTECTVCPEGFECPSLKESVPMSECAAGYYSMGRQQKCKICPPGFYCPAHGGADYGPNVCDEGWYSIGGQISCSQCSEGYYCPTARKSREIPCPPGTWSDVGATDCTRCTGGKICDGTLSGITDCSKGFYCPEGTVLMIPCPEGYYGVATGKATFDEACTICPVGFYCPKGTTDAGATIYTNNICPTGHYCPIGTEFATQYPCHAGTYNDLTQKGSMGDCKVCEVGKYCLEGCRTPQPCRRGHYCPSGTSHWSDHPCKIGTWSENLNNEVDTDCSDCSVGHYCPAGSIHELPCPIGTYNPNTKQYKREHCLPCEAGHYCPITGMSNGTSFQCPRGFYCEPGSAGGYETPCPAGTFSPELELDYRRNCRVCIEGFACLSGTGALSNFAVNEGNNFEKMLPCPPGYFCPGVTELSNQKLDGYQGPMTKYPQEFPCPPGTFNPYVRMTKEGDCTECPGGSYCTGGMARPSGKCDPGFVCTPGSTIKEQVVCPAGTWSKSDGLSDINQCEDCPVGNYCPEHSVIPIPCPPGSYAQAVKTTSRGPSSFPACEICDPGYYCNDLENGVENPPSCGEGYYSAAGATECSQCPAGNYCPNVDTTEVQMIANECPAGKYCNNGTITPTEDCFVGQYCLQGTVTPTNCSIGYYRNSTGAESDSDCTICDPGSYCLLGSPIPTGLCDPGYFCEAGSIGPTQEKCPAGRYRDTPGAGSALDCPLCPPGYYCPVGTANPIDCPEGYYCTEGLPEPIYCPRGRFGEALNLEAELDCTECPAGQYCDHLGATNPTGPCDPGFYCYGGATTSKPTDGITGDLCPRGGIL